MSFPEVIPPGPIQTPEEEFGINRGFIDRAMSLGLRDVSLIWHPWLLGRLDPPMRLLERTSQYVRGSRMDFATSAGAWSRRVAAGG